MKKRIEQLKTAWNNLTYPEGLDKEHDLKSKQAFIDFLDKIIITGYSLFAIVAMISLYLFVTYELL